MAKLLTIKAISAVLLLTVLVLWFIDGQWLLSDTLALYFVAVILQLLRIYSSQEGKHSLLLKAILINACFHLLMLLIASMALFVTITWLNALALYFLLISGLSLFAIASLSIRHSETLKSTLDTKYQVLKAEMQQQIDELKTTLQENQEELESKVQERTLELNIALQELEEANQELAAKSTQDELTGLFNRRFYDQKILAEYRRSRRNLSPLSLIVVDIDYFKKVNDSFGHIAGDECLKAVAQLIKQSLHRSTDIACRYGGEEFCLILPETQAVGAESFAEELRKNVEKLNVSYQEQPINLTISCGVATYQQQDGATPESIFSAADKALYQAKHQGRNQVVIAEDILLQRIEE